MKKLLLFSLAVLMAALAAHADVTINSTNFPDATFRSYLLSEYPSGTITTSQLNARDTLNLPYKGISNMTGVQYFTQLKRLDLYSNNLTSIDVSANTKLIYLNLGYNKLTSINVGSNTVLQELYLQNNQLTTVSVNDHSRLKTLWVRGNTTLTGLYCWRDALTSVDVTGCTALQYLKIYNNYNLTGIYGLADCTNLTWLDVEDTSFSDLSAVAGMAKLETLLAGRTQITVLKTSHSGHLKNLQVAGDTRLTELICYNENLTTLKVTGCSALSTLKCYYNYNLEAITGLADCKALTYLDCEDCAITELPGVNYMTDLQTLWCRNNQLTYLVIENLSQLKTVRVSGNRSLELLHCRYCDVTSLDVTNCTAMSELDCSNNESLGFITGLLTCTALTYLSAEYCALTSLDMTNSPALENLYCYHNNLSSLNVTGLTELKLLNCKENSGLTEITGLADCTKMTYLECSYCPITDLVAVEGMNDLNELWCSGTDISSLRVTDKSNLESLVLNECHSLQVLECSSCALSHLNIFNCSSLYYLDCENNRLPSMSFSTCPELKYLLCNTNQMESIGVGNNTKLLYLWCADNQLTSVDVSNFSDDFLSLDCRYNQISDPLDLTRYTDLYELACSGNQIPQLLLGNHHQLITLYCNDNQLTSLDVSGCPALVTLYAHTNQLTSLDASGHSELSKFYAHDNQLTSLNVDNCPSLGLLSVYLNKINASHMGQIVDALSTCSSDVHGRFYAFVEEDPYEELNDENVITASQVNQANAKYWDVIYWDWEEGEWLVYAASDTMRGDVNGDGAVNITDVTALIDYLLSGAVPPAAADCNIDGDVNITDVTTLIDYLLAGNWPSKVTRAGIGVSAVGCPHLVDVESIVLEKPQRKRH